MKWYWIVAIVLVSLLLVLFISGAFDKDDRTVFIDKCVGAKKDNSDSFYSKKECEDTFDKAMANFKKILLG